MFNVALVVVLNGICPRSFGEVLPTAVHDNIVGFQVSDYLVDVDGWTSQVGCCEMIYSSSASALLKIEFIYSLPFY